MDPNSQQILHQLKSENEDLQRALAAVEKHLETTMAEKDQVNALYQDFKQHYEQMKSQCSQYQRKLGEEIQLRKDLELNQESRLSDMRRAIDQKQREIDSMANKISLPVDSDILRMKIQKDIESRHRLEVDSKQQEIDRLSEQFYENKRQLDITKTQYEALKYENEKEIHDLRERQKQEMHEMLLENQTLQSKIDDKRDRDLIRQLRRDLDEQKRRANELYQENAEARRERDQVKLEKNEQFISFTKDLELERNQKRLVQSELDKSEFKVKCNSEEQQKGQLKLEKLRAEIHTLVSDKNSCDSILKSKDQMIENLNLQLTQQKEDLRAKDIEMENLVRRRQEEERERLVSDRKEKSKLQKEIETLERQIVELENQRKYDVTVSQQEFERVQKELRVMQEERRVFSQRQQENQIEDEAIKQQNALLMQEKDTLDKELRKLQDDHRESLNSQHKLVTDKGHLEASMQITKEEMKKFQQKYEEELNSWKKERQDLHLKIQELIQGSELHNIENNKKINAYKSKSSDYKNKLRKANQQLQTMAARIAKYEIKQAVDRHGRQSEDFQDEYGVNMQVFSNSAVKEDPNIDDISGGVGMIGGMGGDKLNDEIRKILQENQA